MNQASTSETTTSALPEHPHPVGPGVGDHTATVEAEPTGGLRDERFGGRSAGIRRMHHVFETTCDRNPFAVALECDGERLTYRELDERANRLAHCLRDLGRARRRAGGHPAAPLGRHVRGVAGRRQGRRRRSCRSTPSPRRTGSRYIAEDSDVDAGADLVGPRRGDGRARPARCCDSTNPSPRSPPPRRAGPICPQTRSADGPGRLRHLHVRLERPAQGRGGRAVEHLQLPRRGAPACTTCAPATGSIRA